MPLTTKQLDCKTLLYGVAVGADLGQTGKVIVCYGGIVGVGRWDENLVVKDRICRDGQTASFRTSPISHQIFRKCAASIFQNKKGMLFMYEGISDSCKIYIFNFGNGLKLVTMESFVRKCDKVSSVACTVYAAMRYTHFNGWTVTLWQIILWR